MKSFKTTLAVVSLGLAMVLGPQASASGSGMVLPPTDSTPSPSRCNDEPSHPAPLPGPAHSLMVVDLDPETDPAIQIAVQACAGLYNRKFGGAVYTRVSGRGFKWLEELGFEPGETMDAGRFLDGCMAEFPRCARYSYHDQQQLLPNILTVGAVLEAVPVDEKLDARCGEVVFDATLEFKERNTPYLATRYVYENYVGRTTGLAMLNPGYSAAGGKVWDPELVRDMDPAMIDLVYSNKLFVVYLVNGCIEWTRQHELLNRIVSVNPWPKPIGVYGYADYWNVFGGFLFESQTMCSDSRNMGAIPTVVSNLSFFSTRRKPIVGAGEVRQNQPEEVDYDPARTYAAFVVGDGDNISFMLGFRADWFRQRTQACLAGENSCPPLTWSISPHLTSLAPDVLQWYYAMSRQTGKDYFMLPPSGHLYAYPSSLEEETMQDRYIAATESDARLLGTQGTVHWEWFDNWSYAERGLLPKYAQREGPIQGVFPVNVPYMFPTFTWRRNQFFKVLVGQDGGKVVLFRPREWRGISGRPKFLDKRSYLTPEDMARELGGYPRGSVLAVYLTSDGGLTLENSVMELIKILPDHVRLVSSGAAVQLALQASERSD